MAEKTLCKEIQLESGETLYLLVKWWSDGRFDIDVTDGASTWRAEDCRAPSETDIGSETWMAKAREALGYSPTQTTFNFESFVENGSRVLRWSWALAEEAHLRGSGHVVLPSTTVTPCLTGFLSAACEFSNWLAVMTTENRETQKGIEQDMQALKQEVKEANETRKTLYSRCAELFNEKKREIEEKEREIRELRAQLMQRMHENYSEDTS